MAWGGSVMPCRVAWRAVSGMGGGTYGEMMGGTMDAPFLSARFGRSRVVITQCGPSGSSRPFSPWNKITRKLGAE